MDFGSPVCGLSMSSFFKKIGVLNACPGYVGETAGGAASGGNPIFFKKWTDLFFALCDMCSRPLFGLHYSDAFLMEMGSARPFSLDSPINKLPLFLGAGS